jgi:phosphinothricin acetyltransferase
MIRTVLDKDINEITDIYNFYIAETVATFEEEVITPEIMLTRITKVSNDNLPWLVAEDDYGNVTGYAYATKWRERFAYRFSVEVTVYLSPKYLGAGIGTKLYQTLFSELKKRSIHSVIGGITLPNPASIALHEKFAMKQVAHFKDVGFKFGQWRDTGYWQGNIA